MSTNTGNNPFVMRAIESLFDSLSPDDRESFLARSSASSSPASVPMGVQALNDVQAESDNDEDGPSPTQIAIAKTTAAKRRQVLNDRRKKKPMNAFIAYRCKTS